MNTPTRAELTQQALFWVAVSGEAKIRAAQARTVLDEQAREEYARDGAAPTWRIPGVGTVPLSLTQDAVVVTNEPVYTDWVADRYPTEIETIRRVRPAFDEQLRASLVKQGDPPCTEDGDRVPGVEFQSGGRPKGVSIRASAAAKETAAEIARTFLDRMMGVQPS